LTNFEVNIAKVANLTIISSTSLSFFHKTILTQGASIKEKRTFVQKNGLVIFAVGVANTWYAIYT
jgi:hypothetical protein